MKNSIIFLCAAVVAIGVYYAVMALEPAGDSQDISSDEIIVIENGEAAKVEQNAKVRELMDSMDRKAKENRSTDSDKEKRQQEAKEILQGIKSHMVDPEPGTYPVKYFTPDDGVPLVGVSYGLTGRKPVWIDDSHVIYWAGIVDDYPQVQRPFFSSYKLVILNVDTGKIVNTLTEAHEPRALCFDHVTGNFFYGVETDPNSPQGQYYLIGRLDSNQRFVKQKKIESLNEHRVNTIECSFNNDLSQPVLYNARSDDGRIVIVDRDKGTVRNERLNEVVREHTLNMTVGEPIRYDHIRDQYYIGAVFSRTDQRSKIWSFDREFNLVDEFIMPRVKGIQSYPSSSVVLVGVPLKDGFAMDCGRRGSGDGVIDYDGEPVSHYLCHVKRDQTIVRAIKGYPRYYASSPNGCRIFGYVTPHKGVKDNNGLYGKNFMIDVCD
ncbi:MAG: hypothetical protein ACQEQL_00810 [Pseudomonadota bacterium]